jgi:hypothetical protein
VLVIFLRYGQLPGSQAGTKKMSEAKRLASAAGNRSKLMAGARGEHGSEVGYWSENSSCLTSRLCTK